MAASTTFSGPRARFRIGNKIIAYCADVSGSEAVQYEERHVLNLLQVAEHVPVGYVASMSARFFRLIGQSAKATGIFPAYDNILTSGVLSAQIEDTITGQIPYQFIGVRAASKDFDVSARGVVSENISFVCIRSFDEFERPLAA